MTRARSLAAAAAKQPAAERLGGKAANLARLAGFADLGVRVPEAFVLDVDHFDRFVARNRLDAEFDRQRAICPLALDQPDSFLAMSEHMRAAVLRGRLPGRTRAQLRAIAGGRSGLWPGPWIVRSSAIGEDSEADSFAGQLDSIPDVRGLTGPAGLEQALRRCWASYWSARVLAYQRARGCGLRGMAVIVQRMISARRGGVLFTRVPGPVPGEPELELEPELRSGEMLAQEMLAGPMLAREMLAGAMLVEYVEGHPGPLVAGAVVPTRRVLDRQRPPRAAPFAQLLSIGDALERAFAGPQDLEWLVDDAGQLWIVQCRPITARPGPTQRFSNVNVNENYPRPISPLLYSIASEAYEQYFRNLGRLLGVPEATLAQVAPALRHCVGVHGARLYYDLDNIHRAIAAAPFGERLAAAFDGFVGVEDEGRVRPGRVAVRGHPAGIGGRWTQARTLALGLWRARNIAARVARFEARVGAYAARTAAPERLEVPALLARFSEFIELRLHRWTDAAIADLAATLAYAWLRSILTRTLGSAAAIELPPTLLLAIPEVERCAWIGAGPVRALWTLSREIRAEPALRRAFAAQLEDDPEGLLATIRTEPQFHGFARGLAAYLDEFGFRSHGELLLTCESFVERPATLLPVLAAYAELDGPSPGERLAGQAAARDRAIAELRRRLPLGWRWRFGLALRATQRAIAWRERARFAQARLYARFRAVVGALGEALVHAGRLERRDDLLFLRWREIDAWLTGHAMDFALVPELIGLRRREHARLSALQPPDELELALGEYFDPAGPEPAARSDERAGDEPRGPSERVERAGPGTSTIETLVGVGVAGGRATCVVRVLGDPSEAGELGPGDCLVARQTDPGWAPLLFLAKGLILERGGMLSHGAIVAREFGIPGVIAVPGVTQTLRSGDRVEIDGDRGLVRVLGRGGQA